MPPIQRGHVRKLPSGRWQLRYYDDDGERQTGGTFATKTAAFAHYRDVIEPRLDGVEPEPRAHARRVRRASTSTGTRSRAHAHDRHAAAAARLRDSTSTATCRSRELERMVDELAGWRAAPERSRYGIVGALRRRSRPAVRWGYMSANPANARRPEPGSRRRARSALHARRAGRDRRGVAHGLPAARRRSSAATGLRPEEWAPLERARRRPPGGYVNVRRTVSDGEVVERQDDLAPAGAAHRRALAALDALPPGSHAALFPAPAGGMLVLDNFRRREWARPSRRPGREPGADLRPALDVRLERARRRRDRVRARAA